jgi:hypothetical protein
MNMTHYMELLASNQPWNLIIYMAIPVILAETIAITELYLLLTRKFSGKVRQVNRVASIIVGLYFLGIFTNLLFTAVIPLTFGGGWRGVADVLAVGFYLAGIIPLLGLSLLDMNIISRNKSTEQKLKTHVFFVALFLITAHVAMIFGMLNPEVLGYKAKAPMEPMAGMHVEASL